MSLKGVVAAPQPQAAEAGRSILEAGGTAFDAAIAAALVQGVVDPLMCGIGGMGVATIGEAATGEVHILEFYGRAGSKARENLFSSEILLAENGKPYVKGFLNEIGYTSILVPGTIAGLEALHEKGGRLPWKELVAPAIRLLEEGFPFYDHILDYYRYPFPPQSPSIEERLSATKEMARFFLPGATLPKLGDPYRNGDYLESLRILAKEGPRSFYQGRLAQAMVKDWEAQGAFITGEDLASYQVSWVKPLKVNWGPLELCSNPSPGGGPTLFLILKLLQTLDISALPLGSLPYYKVLLQSFQVAFSHRKETLGDGVSVDGEEFYREENLKALWERRFSPIQEESSPGTTHLTVADGEGNVIALTHTLGSCSGVITAGLGFPYNNGMNAFDLQPGGPNALAPGKRRLSGMAPTLVLEDETPLMALGSPGSNAIITAIAQVLLHHHTFRLTPLEAVAYPRVHAEGEEVLLEGRIPSRIAKELLAEGFQVTVAPRNYEPRMGRVQLIYRGREEGKKVWKGISDPRRDGGVALEA